MANFTKDLRSMKLADSWITDWRILAGNIEQLRFSDAARLDAILPCLQESTGFRGDRRPVDRPIVLPPAGPGQLSPGFEWLRKLASQTESGSINDFKLTAANRDCMTQLTGFIRSEVQDTQSRECLHCWLPLKKLLDDGIVPVKAPVLSRAEWNVALPRTTIFGRPSAAKIPLSPDFFHQHLESDSLVDRTLALFYCLKSAVGLACELWRDTRNQLPDVVEAEKLLVGRGMPLVQTLHHGFSSALHHFFRSSHQLMVAITENRNRLPAMSKEYLEAIFQPHLEKMYLMASASLPFFTVVLKETARPMEDTQMDVVANFLGLDPFLRGKMLGYVGDLGSPDEWQVHFVPHETFEVIPTIDLNPNGFTDGALVDIRERGGLRLGCPAREVIKQMMPLVSDAYIRIVAAPAVGISC